MNDSFAMSDVFIQFVLNLHVAYVPHACSVQLQYFTFREERFGWECVARDLRLDGLRDVPFVGGGQVGAEKADGRDAGAGGQGVQLLRAREAPAGGPLTDGGLRHAQPHGHGFQGLAMGAEPGGYHTFDDGPAGVAARVGFNGRDALAIRYALVQLSAGAWAAAPCRTLNSPH